MVPKRWERLSVGNAGWCRYASDRRAFFVRVAARGDRLVICELYVADDHGLNTTSLRRLPIARIEAWLNSPDLKPNVLARLDGLGPDLGRLADHYASTFGRKSPVQLLQLPPVDHGDQNFLERLVDSEPDARIVPPERPYPDDFYRQVAAIYSALTRITHKPSARIAGASGLPITTVHRWIKVARSKGFLETAGPGKAG